jgi:NAD(P)-dependent dehydrogenase (short-subunit alcohol dehydrogenase family)
MSDISFAGQVAIVTGAGAGLGRFYAIELGKRGAKVVANDLGSAKDGAGASRAAADNVVDEIKALGGEAVASYDSVATREGGERIVSTAINTFGKVQILVNNAGFVRDKVFVNMDEESWDAVIAVHLKGAYCVSKPAFKNMKEHGYGRIVMTSSGAGLSGNFGQANYAAAKMAILGLTNVLKLEGEKHGIKVNAVLPNAATRMSEGAMPMEAFEKLKPEHIVPAVLYLCSSQCRDSGMYINAVGGYISRSAVLTSRGVTGILTPEQVSENWDKIVQMDEPEPHNSLPEMVMNILNTDLARRL